MAIPALAISLAAETTRSSPLSGNTIRRLSVAARWRILSTKLTCLPFFPGPQSSPVFPFILVNKAHPSSFLSW
jgi:hypothetical protein